MGIGATQSCSVGCTTWSRPAIPLNAPLTARPDWRPARARLAAISTYCCKQALDGFGSRIAILNCLYAVQTLFSEDMGAALARAVNDWLAKEWLDRDPRLRAPSSCRSRTPKWRPPRSSAAPPTDVSSRCCCPVSDQPLGRRLHWPIYEAAQRHGLPVAIHAGSTYRHPVTPVGWPSTFTEDYVAQAQGFQTQLTSLVCEGVLSRFSDLTFVLRRIRLHLAAGLSVAADEILARAAHGDPMGRPAAGRSDPARRCVSRLQPVDAPPDSDDILRVIDHIGSEDLLLFSTDYPHWQFDGDDPIPAALPAALRQKLLWDNPLATYARIREGFA